MEIFQRVQSTTGVHMSPFDLWNRLVVYNQQILNFPYSLKVKEMKEMLFLKKKNNEKIQTDFNKLC